MAQTMSPARLAEKVWLTLAEAASYSGIGKTRLYGYVQSGELRAAKLGGTWHLRRSDVDLFLESKMSAT